MFSTSTERRKKNRPNRKVSQSPAAAACPCKQRAFFSFGRDAACRLPAGVCVHNLPDLNAASCPAGCGEYSGPESSRLFPGRFGPKRPPENLDDGAAPAAWSRVSLPPCRRQAGIFPENPNNPAGPEGPVNGAEPPPIHHGGELSL